MMFSLEGSHHVSCFTRKTIKCDDLKVLLMLLVQGKILNVMMFSLEGSDHVSCCTEENSKCDEALEGPHVSCCTVENGKFDDVIS
ncbi:hypothetical protein NPIL_400541 [Nephila pilipes]|uniref:Uncharacterized protein n=1 Tax=Nephila pilipes TaxID=299642 RepID=A0A8X6TTE3_NEPPI|nr:hypothetical protein NPIL_400541 [Nephila pilipes]